MQTCLNCGTHFKGNYCPACGQKVTGKRITGSVLIEDAIHFFTHLEKGFLHTTWNFLARPGLVSINFLEGKRKRYQPPVSYLLIWTTLYILAHNLIINHYGYSLTNEVSPVPLMSTEANNLLRSHFTIFIIPLLLMSALFIYMILARPMYYFTEILTLTLYGAGTYFMMLFASDIILGSIFHINILTTNIFSWQTLLSSAYNLWFTYDFFKRVGLRLFWPRLAAATVLITVTGWIILVYLPQAWIYITGIIN